jgi:hypothetical protein
MINGLMIKEGHRFGLRRARLIAIPKKSDRLSVHLQYDKPG